MRRNLFCTGTKSRWSGHPGWRFFVRRVLFDSAGYGPISHGLKVATCMTQLPLAVRVAVAA
jgi:hypothetical protein